MGFGREKRKNLLQNDILLSLKEKKITFSHQSPSKSAKIQKSSNLSEGFRDGCKG
jgi:hypothetical protein